MSDPLTDEQLADLRAYCGAPDPDGDVAQMNQAIVGSWVPSLLATIAARDAEITALAEWALEARKIVEILPCEDPNLISERGADGQPTGAGTFVRCGKCDWCQMRARLLGEEGSDDPR